MISSDFLIQTIGYVTGACRVADWMGAERVVIHSGALMGRTRREALDTAHRASLDPAELAAMVKAVRHIEMALGSGEKRVADCERPNIEVARKSIVAARPISAGEEFTEENITVKRPGNGISPMDWDSVIGKKAKKDFPYDSLIEL